MGDEEVASVRSPERGVLIVGALAGLLPFAISSAKASYSTVNGEVVDLQYSDVVAQGGGAVAVLCGLIALAMAAKAKKTPMIAAAVVVMVLGGFQLARGFGAFYKPDLDTGFGRGRGPIAYEPPVAPLKKPIDPKTCASQDECDNLHADLKKKDPVGASIARQRSCDFGANYACHELGADYLEVKDVARAVALFEKGCKLENGDSCNTVAVIYLNGDGVPKDLEKARGFFELSCTHRFALGCKNLALVHREGMGVTADDAKAFEYAMKSCAIDSWNSGDAKAVGYGCNMAGQALFIGRGAKVDKKAAAEQFARACDRSPYWCYNHGVMVAEVEKDLPKARRLYEASCNDDNIDACNNLGDMMNNGVGGPVDKKTAKALFQKACDGKLELGCENLKTMK